MKSLAKKIKLYFHQLDYIYLLLALCVLFTSVVFRIVVPVQPADGLVFDELYFVPQSESYIAERYYFDIHPPLGKMLLYFGEILVVVPVLSLPVRKLFPKASFVSTFYQILTVAGGNLVGSRGVILNSIEVQGINSQM